MEGWKPIAGPAKTAWPTAYDRIATAVKALTPAQRTIELTDVIFDGKIRTTPKQGPAPRGLTIHTYDAEAADGMNTRTAIKRPLTI